MKAVIVGGVAGAASAADNICGGNSRFHSSQAAEVARPSIFTVTLPL